MSDLTAGALIAGISRVIGTLLGVMVAGFHANRLISRQEHFLREERKASEEERQRAREAGLMASRREDPTLGS